MAETLPGSEKFFPILCLLGLVWDDKPMENMLSSKFKASLRQTCRTVYSSHSKGLERNSRKVITCPIMAATTSKWTFYDSCLLEMLASKCGLKLNIIFTFCILRYLKWIEFKCKKENWKLLEDKIRKYLGPATWWRV